MLLEASNEDLNGDDSKDTKLNAKDNKIISNSNDERVDFKKRFRKVIDNRFSNDDEK